MANALAGTVEERAMNEEEHVARNPASGHEEGSAVMFFFLPRRNANACSGTIAWHLLRGICHLAWKPLLPGIRATLATRTLPCSSSGRATMSRRAFVVMHAYACMHMPACICMHGGRSPTNNRDSCNLLYRAGEANPPPRPATPATGRARRFSPASIIIHHHPSPPAG